MNKRSILLFFGDAVLAYAALVIMTKLSYWGSFGWPIILKHIGPFSFVYLFWFALIYAFDLYDVSSIRPGLELFGKISQAFILSIVIGISLFYLAPFLRITPKTNLLITALVFAVLLWIWRRLFHSVFKTYALRNIAFLGENNLSEKLEQEIKDNPQLGYTSQGFLNNENIKQQVKDKNLDTVVVAKKLEDNPGLAQQLYQCLPLRVDFIDLAQAYEELLHEVPVDHLNQSWFLENLAEGKKQVYDKLKRLEDVVLSILFIIITSPLWLLFAISIKIEDQGKVFLAQKRVGIMGEKLTLYKFRSMVENAEKNGAQWAKDGDKRVTKTGKFMRKTHLDELPQMINILKGDISLIGPRPERPQFVKKLNERIPHYSLRHIIKPGFTGWAQIKFRYARSLEDSQQKFQYDLYYIKNRSLFLDLGILLKTLQLFFKQ
ncbi:MAG: sugar transferase [Candidatus Paceibacterota bacterium]